MRKVRVAVDKLGAWWKGDVFKTSDSHAKGLVDAGQAEFADIEKRAVEPEYENKGVVLDSETQLEPLKDWPDWLWESPKKSLAEAGVTPHNVGEHSVEQLTAIYRIGEATAKKLLAWDKENK